MNGFPSLARHIVTGLMLLGLCIMFAASFSSLVNKGKVEVSGKRVAQAAGGEKNGRSANATGDPVDNPGLTGRQADDIAKLMQRALQNPEDPAPYIALGEQFMVLEDWRRAEAFLIKAVAIRPEDATPRRMMAVCQFKQNRPEDAAKTFEELLAIRDDALALYDLATIYKYYLNNNERAVVLLNRALGIQDAEKELLDQIRGELAQSVPQTLDAEKKTDKHNQP